MSNEKYNHLLDYINSNGYVYIVLYNKMPGVDIPSYLKEDAPYTKLRISNLYSYQPTFNLLQLEAKLSFKGEYYDCIVPYDAINYIGALSPEENIDNSKFYLIDYDKQNRILKASNAEIEYEDD